MNCKTCKHWHPEGFGMNSIGNQSPDATNNIPAGTCRRYAPSARVNNWRSWPITIATDFCHDYVMTEVKAVEPPKPTEHGWLKSKKKPLDVSVKAT